MITIGETNIVKAYLGQTELVNVAIGDELLLSSEPPAPTDTEDFIFGKRIQTNDNLSNANTYSDVVTRYFEVTGGHQIKWSAAVRNSYIKINELGSTMNFLFQTSNKAFPYTLTLRSDTCYVRFCTLESVLDSAYLYDLTESKWIWKGKDAKLT